jgi:hypothetical protein
MPPPDTPPPPSQPNQQPSQWRENTKTALEIFGLLVLCAYTVFSCLQWLQIRWTNRLTREALTHSEDTLTQTLIKMQGQIDVANKANEISKTQFQKDQRPYVAELANSIENPGFYEIPQSPGMGQITWTWHLTNYGKTPAYDMSFREWIKMGDGKFERSYSAHSDGRPDLGGAVPPGSPMYHTVVSKPISKDEFTQLMAKDEGITIRVVIDYRDSYGIWYQTGLCQSHLRSNAIEECRQYSYIR